MTPVSHITDSWRAELERITQAGLLREAVCAQGRDTTTVDLGGRSLLNFSSNDYLGLSFHPRVVEAAREAASRWGTGSGASRLVCGSLDLHRELEEALARFKGSEAALVFSSGYLAALGVIQTLAVRRDGTTVPVFFDRLSHASMVDAARHCGAPWRTFAHNDPEALERLLKKYSARRPGAAGGGGAAGAPGGVLSADPVPSVPAAVVITEGVFSMDGDMAPLPELLAMCERWGAVLVVDDAHGTGTVGPGGRGTVARFGLEAASSPHLVQMGTLSKALGAQGGFIAGPAVLIRLLVNRARAFIYDTALAPPAAAAAREALRIVEEEPERIEALKSNARLLRGELPREDAPAGTTEAVEEEEGAKATESVAGAAAESADETPIIPVILGNAQKTVETSRRLREAGYLAVAIRPPTVPPGTSRLRLTVTAAHAPEQIRALAQAIGAACAAPAGGVDGVKLGDRSSAG